MLMEISVDALIKSTHNSNGLVKTQSDESHVFNTEEEFSDSGGHI